MSRIKLPPEALKRKYNAASRLRKKLGLTKFPKYQKNIYSSLDENLLQIAEVKILINEFGFVIKPLIK